MKKLIAALLTLVLMVSAVTVGASAAAEKFTDVNPNKWYYAAVDYAVGEGLFSGTSAATFSPNEPMTRGMFVTVLGHKAKIDPAQYTESSFSDVKAGKWYAPFVEWAAQNGIVNGVCGVSFPSLPRIISWVTAHSMEYFAKREVLCPSVKRSSTAPMVVRSQLVNLA